MTGAFSRKDGSYIYRKVPVDAEEGSVEMNVVNNTRVSTRAEPERERLPTFDMVPVECRCPFCRADITTFITHEASIVSYLLALVLVLILQWLSICILPVVWPLLKDTVHRCPNCLNKIGSRSKIALPTSLKNDVLTFRIGHCAVVLARRYVVILLALVTVIGLFYVARSSGVMQPAMVPRGPDIDASWKDFLTDCGERAYLGNPLHSVKAFEEKYKYQTVKWKGRVVRIREGIDLWLFKTKSFAMIKMFPPQQAYRPDVVDLILLFDGPQQHDEVSLIPAGSWAQFEASLLSLGRRGGPHLLQLWSIKESDRPEEVEEAVAEAALALSARQAIMGAILGGDQGHGPEANMNGHQSTEVHPSNIESLQHRV
ncbi:lipopolysaccharide-induced transcription factor regulating tumor necrosis factor alpha, putative [Perkinsus marinus ATCC 50983]|uniref:Lipopolysaccharide-induced transcription factor regulating tumor necrosis factor alpha, putative n=2 Tax=Perkinsus marinus (strain ATCC 50983 / TXsc) TaxID=423536 RepID=C5KTJ8_PERM5|nr:lipopolysaccharide-induced transcription factor regulating tumor necrosis factor alpha, putative [Perkinsus marinus ATCC 50983]EER12177.1 lipopolysaccharide-induced transcription factor regulating tumor necrosis factor alpha, putative [Perkinsus marinus ATCC 50983]|eukprot:XP_002780382.1 lipopolysaccharide-induced transcription factor regulating tumor necrosis factor alpha, putative [Perkinsus marinus ATCC 50983]